MRPRSLHSDQQQRGFTLMEVIVSMVIMGIIGVGFSSLFVNQLTHYMSGQARLDLVGSARNAMTRMTLELNDAVANSIRLEANGQCMQFESANKHQTGLTGKTAMGLSENAVRQIRYCLHGGALRRAERTLQSHTSEPARGDSTSGVLLAEHLLNETTMPPLFRLQTMPEPALSQLTITMTLAENTEIVTLDHNEIVRNAH